MSTLPAVSYVSQSGYPVSFLQVSFQLTHWTVLHCIKLMLIDGKAISRESVENHLFGLLLARGTSFCDHANDAVYRGDDYIQTARLYLKASALTTELFPELNSIHSESKEGKVAQ